MSIKQSSFIVSPNAKWLGIKSNFPYTCPARRKPPDQYHARSSDSQLANRKMMLSFSLLANVPPLLPENELQPPSIVQQNPVVEETIEENNMKQLRMQEGSRRRKRIRTASTSISVLALGSVLVIRNVQRKVHETTDDFHQLDEDIDKKTEAPTDSDFSIKSDTNVEHSFTTKDTAQSNDNMKSVFSASRAEWEDMDSQFAQEQNSSTDVDTNQSTTTNSSGEYSYSYRRSRRSENISEPTTPNDIQTEANEQFSGMRSEFTTNKVVQRVQPKGQKHSSELIDSKGPGTVSAGSVTKWMMSVPLYIVREIVVPVIQVGTVAWYDMKVWIGCLIEGRDEENYFMDAVEVNEQEEVEELPQQDELSDEELQILAMQKNAQKVAKNVQGVVNVVRGNVTKLWEDLL